MARNVAIYGFGRDEHPYVDRPPLPRAEFRLPPDIHVMNLTLDDDFLEITLRVPVPSSSPIEGWPGWCPGEQHCPAPLSHRAKALPSDEEEGAA